MACKLRRKQTRDVALLFIMGIGLLAARCSTCGGPKPDPDGNWNAAVDLPLETWRSDQLQCNLGDCTDWYQITVPESGELRVNAEFPQQSVAEYSIFLTLANDRARAIVEDASQSEDTLSVGAPVAPGVYLVSLVSIGDAGPLLRYDVIAHFEAPEVVPKPQQPLYHLLHSEVLEIVREPGQPDVVLLDHGTTDGIIEGQTGRLVNGDFEIAQIEITAVYESGCRARLTNSPGGPITPDTRAEISVLVTEPRPQYSPGSDSEGEVLNRRELDPGQIYPSGSDGEQPRAAPERELLYPRDSGHEDELEPSREAETGSAPESPPPHDPIRQSGSIDPDRR